MVSLIDIVPQTRAVEIVGGTLTLRGLGLRQIADLLMRFPSLRKLVTWGAPAFDIDELLLHAPDAIGAIIAEAARQPEAAEAIPDSLALDDVVSCLLAIRELTIPADPVPFLERLARLLSGGAGQISEARDTSLPPLPNGSSQPGTIAAT